MTVSNVMEAIAIADRPYGIVEADEYQLFADVILNNTDGSSALNHKLQDICSTNGIYHDEPVGQLTFTEHIIAVLGIDTK